MAACAQHFVNITQSTPILAYTLMYVHVSLGEMINEKDRCKVCMGKKIVSEKKKLEVHIDKGMKDGQRIPFRGEGDQSVS